MLDRSVEESEIPALYAAADFAVAPYRAVTTPGSLILALSLGVPVIAPALPPVLELLKSKRREDLRELEHARFFEKDPDRPNLAP